MPAAYHKSRPRRDKGPTDVRRRRRCLVQPQQKITASDRSLLCDRP